MRQRELHIADNKIERVSLCTFPENMFYRHERRKKNGCHDYDDDDTGYALGFSMHAAAITRSCIMHGRERGMTISPIFREL